MEDTQTPVHMTGMTKKQNHPAPGHNPERIAAVLALRSSGAPGAHLQGTRGQRTRSGGRIAAIRESAEAGR